MKQIVIIMVLSASAWGLGAGDAERGAELYQKCVSCHGPEGHGSEEFHAPNLTGFKESYVIRQLVSYKKGTRGANDEDRWAATMVPMVNEVIKTQQDIQDLAAYIKTFDIFVPPAGKITGDIENGKKYYDAVCQSCHGAVGDGQDHLGAGHSPRLDIQYDWYLYDQIKHFKTGVRGSDFSDPYSMEMRPMAMALTSDELVKDVVAYIMTFSADKRGESNKPEQP